MRVVARENELGHFDMEAQIMREFSYRYKSLFGVEGTWNGDANQFVLRIVIVGLTIGITGGISVGTEE